MLEKASGDVSPVSVAITFRRGETDVYRVWTVSPKDLPRISRHVITTGWKAMQDTMSICQLPLDMINVDGVTNHVDGLHLLKLHALGLVTTVESISHQLVHTDRVPAGFQWS